MEYQSEPYRIFCTDDAGKCVAEITFPETEAGVCCIDHTFVDDSLRGMGIAGELVSRAVQQIQANGKQVTATCSYAAHWRRTLAAGASKRGTPLCIRILKSRLFYS